MAIVYIALGANLGDRRANMAEALRLMAPDVEVEVASSLYESVPQPPAPPPSYYNAACRVFTDLAPHALLRYLKDIERRIGRKQAPRWDPRVIDLDIVLYDELVLETPELTIPHARLAERNFVLSPLLDIDSALVHPKTGKSLADLLASVGLDGLNRIDGPEWTVSPGIRKPGE